MKNSIKKFVRILSLVCVLAIATSSVAFAAVPLPVVGPANESYIVMPWDSYDFGYKNYLPVAPINGKIPIQNEGAKSGAVLSYVKYYDRVYTLNGEAATRSTRKDTYKFIRVDYDPTVFGVQGYIRSANLVPVSKLRTVNAGKGALNYYSYPTYKNGSIDLSTAKGSLSAGTIVEYIGSEMIEGDSWTRVRVFFPNNSSTKQGVYYVLSTGLDN